MGFHESYKRLDRLCGELFDCERGITAYIEEMQHTPMGAHYVKNWEADLKKLKHDRWVRNQISHEPGCTEETMCKPDDAEWLDSFYTRIMNQTDPLALYCKTTGARPARRSAPAPVQPDRKGGTGRTYLLGIALFVIALLAIAAVLLVSR